MIITRHARSFSTRPMALWVYSIQISAGGG